MTKFRYDFRHWPSAALLRAHLAQYPPSIASWAKGVTLHHTWKPRRQDWRGLRTMQGIKRYYEGLGWDAGPHLFIAHGSPDPAHDGIWQMTALNEKGIHAGYPANAQHWGIEVVGSYDTEPWPWALHDLVRDTTLALLDWRGLAVSAGTLKGHREWGSPKTCPGKAIDMNIIRTQFAQAQAREQ
jgi:hypothetical protein